MELFRISTEEYAYQLNSSGRPNRWNKKGEFVIYAGGSRSLVTLEMIVHRESIKPELNYKVMTLSVPDSDKLFKSLNTNKLPQNWRQVRAYSTLQEIGSVWNKSGDTLIFKVPSV